MVFLSTSRDTYNETAGGRQCPSEKSVFGPRLSLENLTVPQKNRPICKIETPNAISAHNHPSGVATPGYADETLTQALKQALASVDVRILDHLLVAAKAFRWGLTEVRKAYCVWKQSVCIG